MWGIVVNNKYYFKRFFLSSVYIVNLDMDLTTSIDTKYFGLTIMSDQKKYGFGEYTRSKILGFGYHVKPKVIWVWRTCPFKILGFDNQPNPRQTWVWKWWKAKNTFVEINFLIATKCFSFGNTSKSYIFFKLFLISVYQNNMKTLKKY
jgi:hypothetical protein